jgi:hypothetical protein
VFRLKKKRTLAESGEELNDGYVATISDIRRFLLGRLRLTPREAGCFRLADIYDAITGYNEEDSAHFRRTAELIRTSTALLWNVHVSEESRMEADELWRFGWEAAGDGPQATGDGQDSEEVLRRQELVERHEEWLKDK